MPPARWVWRLGLHRIVGIMAATLADVLITVLSLRAYPNAPRSVFLVIALSISAMLYLWFAVLAVRAWRAHRQVRD